MLYALVVIYNKKCEDSLTLNTLKEYDNKLNIIVFDNSEKDFNNKDYCDRNNYKYYTKNKNVGLSKAYNYVLKKIEKKDDDYLIILDDDTNLTKQYFKEVFKETSLNKYDVLLPIVKSNNVIISPSKVQFNCRIKVIKNIAELNNKNITAINSGMVVKTNVYNDIIYNEDMFLDYIDHDFMSKIRKNNFKINVLKSEIIQNFSRNEKGNLKGALFRFNIYIKDFKIYCRNANKMIFYYINITKFAIKQCIKYRSLKFLKKDVNNR